MAVSRRFAVLLFGALVGVAFAPSGADAQIACQWFGTAPLCSGKCPAGWFFRRRSAANCTNGWKVLCCRRRYY